MTHDMFLNHKPARRPVFPVLLGMMGVGKTRVGRLLAPRLNMGFVDLDTLIEDDTGLSIPGIFKEYGEEEFRRIEARLLQKCLKGPPCVLAPGGGACLHPPSRQLLKERALTLWLKARPETLAERLKNSHKERPLLAGEDKMTTLQKLMKERTPLYTQADFHLDTDGKSPEKIAEELAQFLHHTPLSTKEQHI